MREYNDFKYAYLFGGGAIRGTAHVGVIKALEEAGITPTVLAGSSVGSLVAALYAVGYTPEELAEVFLSVNFELFRDISFGFNSRFALSKGEVFLDWLRDLIEKKYYGEAYLKGQCKRVTFADINRDLIIISTNIKDFSCHEFSNFETPDFEIAMAVRISCCMPGLMGAVAQDQNLLVDGDLMKGKPMWTLSKNLKDISDRILEIRLEGSFSGSEKNPLEYVNGMYSCMTYSETAFIKEIYGKNDRYDYLVIDTGGVVVVDFNYPNEKRQAIIDAGYKQTKEYFTIYLPQKKHDLIEVYLKILDSLRTMQGFFLMKKFLAGKNSLSELFVYLSKYNNIVDADIITELQAFSQVVFSNVRAGLMGRAKCTNVDTVKQILNNLIQNLTNRVASLEAYNNKFSD